MANFRKFWLLNAAGERFGLNGERGVYLTEPEGLGYVLSPVFADLKNGFFRETESDAEPQQTQAGTLVFLNPTAYQSYRTFVDWVNAAGSLRLAYLPFGDAEYYREVFVNYLQKGELTRTRWLNSPLALFGLSPWYRPEPTALDMSAGVGGSFKRYTYRYTANLRYGFDAASQLRGTVNPAGHVPAALQFAFYGSVVDPVLSLIGDNTGTLYGRAAISATLGATDTLEYSSMYRNSYVRARHADGSVTDLLDSVDLGAEPFFRSPVTEPATFSMSSAAGFTGEGSLEIYYYYRSR